MSLILSGTDGLSDVDGSAATPAIRGTDANTGIFFPAADTIAFAEGGAEVARFDSAGNLGLGVTPSPFTRKAFQLGDAAAAYVANNSGGATVIATNMYFDGSNKYATTAAAARYSVGTGTHEWYNAPSGTAGNAITFTQAMTLDASGNLGLGVTPSAWTTFTSAIEVPGGALAGISANQVGVWQNCFYNSSSFKYKSTAAATLYQQGGGTHAWYNAASGTAGNTITFTQAMTLDASGNLLVGATSGSSKLLVVGTGTVATFTSTTTSQISIQAANGTGYNARIYMECPGVNAGGLGYVRSTSRLYAWSSTEDSGPYVVANGTSWTTNSDARLKTNVQNISYGIDAVLALSPKEYEYKIDEGKKCLGFIAQDVVAIIPELVDVPEDSSEMMGIEYQAFIPVLVKAIQEQQALITQLTARITALESA